MKKTLIALLLMAAASPSFALPAPFSEDSGPVMQACEQLMARFVRANGKGFMCVNDETSESSGIVFLNDGKTQIMYEIHVRVERDALGSTSIIYNKKELQDLLQVMKYQHTGATVSEMRPYYLAAHKQKKK